MAAKKYCYEFPRPALTVDTVIFTFTDNKLKILLIERGIDPFIGSWAFPGGFINEGELVEHAAQRELYEETNLEVKDLKHYYTASGPDRDPRGWTVSTVFIGFVNGTQLNTIAGDDAKSVSWFSIDELPSLAFDHDLILNVSKNTLLQISRFSIVGPKLLQENFSRDEIKSLYNQIGNSADQSEALIDRLIDKHAIYKIDDELFTFNKEICGIINEKGFCNLI
jgi:8-oxo-dGTP diphosphatase